MSSSGRVSRHGQFAVESGREGDTHVVRPRGSLDLANAEPLAAELKRAEASDAREILLDLTGLEFMDSVGLRTLIEADRRSRDDGGRFRLQRGSGQVDRLLRLTGVDAILPFDA
jgi:anti-sigma B factor antagonist